MKKTLTMALLLSLGLAWSAQAVVIHWATDEYGSLTYANVGAAVLVYVESDVAPTYANDVISNGSELGSRVTGHPPLTASGVWQQSVSDETTRSAGGYYVVLFNEDQTQFAYSTSMLAFNDTTWDAFTTDEMAPATGAFVPGAFSEWANVPEPSTACLLLVGAAAAVLRRRRRCA